MWIRLTPLRRAPTAQVGQMGLLSSSSSSSSWDRASLRVEDQISISRLSTFDWDLLLTVDCGSRPTPDCRLLFGASPDCRLLKEISRNSSLRPISLQSTGRLGIEWGPLLNIKRNPLAYLVVSELAGGAVEVEEAALPVLAPEESGALLLRPALLQQVSWPGNLVRVDCETD